jgi:hypothetical protein
MLKECDCSARSASKYMLSGRNSKRTVAVGGKSEWNDEHRAELVVSLAELQRWLLRRWSFSSLSLTMPLLQVTIALVASRTQTSSSQLNMRLDEIRSDDRRALLWNDANEDFIQGDLTALYVRHLYQQIVHTICEKRGIQICGKTQLFLLD